jgi:methyltransferase FkbM-like protein
MVDSGEIQKIDFLKLDVEGAELEGEVSTVLVLRRSLHYPRRGDGSLLPLAQHHP